MFSSVLPQSSFSEAVCVGGTFRSSMRPPRMGNALGDFKIYWDLIRKYPKFQGGFIWDLIDQSPRWTGKDDKMIYGYDGDFDNFSTGDFNYSDNGLLNPDRIPNPHIYEVSYFYQNIRTTAGDLSKGEIKIYNENFFRNLSALYAFTTNWSLAKELVK